MKISFDIGPRERNITAPEAFDISYEHKGCICNVMVYGDINKPQVLIVPFTPLPAIPISRYWFFMNISWSKLDGFEFNQYSDPEISISLEKTVGILKGTDKILINNGFLTLTFRAEVNQTDLSKNDPIIFLKKCREFGIRVANVEFSELRILDKVNFSGIRLYNVAFLKSDLIEADFNNSHFNDVKFINSNLERANFTNCLFSKVEFKKVRLKESVFDNCRVVYNKSRIQNNEILIFEDCDLTKSRFIKAKICSNLENSNLSLTNFTEVQFVACKIYDCTLQGTIFTKSVFTTYGTQSDKSHKQNINIAESITCRIGTKPLLATNGIVTSKGNINNCKFDSALMNYIDISNNIIQDTDFEGAYLLKAKLYNCKFIRTTFNGKTLKSADISDTNLSFSIFDQCNLSEVKLHRARMIETKIEKSDLVKANFYNASLTSSYFIESNLTGADFRYADLTLLNLDKCHLNSAKFFHTQRGGLNLNIVIVTNESDKQAQNNKVYQTSCFIDCIDWSPKGDGEIQIDKNSFLSIVSGDKSAVAVISNLSKEGAQFILNTYATANAKNAGNDLIDGSTNIDGDVHNSEILGASIETEQVVEQSQEESSEIHNSYSDESSNQEDEQR
ncbi:pentapeptide repeat-containing protein [Nostoc sp. CENA67]|uniref:Pentapeptide repeat-containing protein n=1 Tax=Amazonocrinis nigriterrae CENA67 TaxID=2794033 RepID=A0A8J7LAY7_9NOST|nr:pentapeptide repeat-containing protein [Amazonocrinis nigriterrae]MBH8567214.1 pentapeptide repeat-containing protein [Amazonocrinis nigriterrae CENA67]